MITDGHKDKKDKKAGNFPNDIPDVGSQGVPGAGVLYPQSVHAPHLPQSYSTPNLVAAGQGFGYQQTYGHPSFIHPMPFAHGPPNVGYGQSATVTPNRSRPASPSAPTSSAKRQRADGPQVPDGLRMTAISDARPSVHQFTPYNWNGVSGNARIAMASRHANAAHCPHQNQNRRPRGPNQAGK